MKRLILILCIFYILFTLSACNASDIAVSSDHWPSESSFSDLPAPDFGEIIVASLTSSGFSALVDKCSYTEAEAYVTNISNAGFTHNTYIRRSQDQSIYVFTASDDTGKYIDVSLTGQTMTILLSYNLPKATVSP